jgi:hypothetical protein
MEEILITILFLELEEAYEVASSIVWEVHLAGDASKCLCTLFF